MTQQEDYNNMDFYDQKPYLVGSLLSITLPPMITHLNINQIVIYPQNFEQISMLPLIELNCASLFLSKATHTSNI